MELESWHLKEIELKQLFNLLPLYITAMTQTRSYFKYLKQLMIEQLKDAHYGARNKYHDNIDVSNIFWAVRWQSMGYHFIPK